MAYLFQTSTATVPLSGAPYNQIAGNSVGLEAIGAGGLAGDASGHFPGGGGGGAYAKVNSGNSYTLVTGDVTTGIQFTIPAAPTIPSLGTSGTTSGDCIIKNNAGATQVDVGSGVCNSGATAGTTAAGGAVVTGTGSAGGSGTASNASGHSGGGGGAAGPSGVGGNGAISTSSASTPGGGAGGAANNGGNATDPDGTSLNGCTGGGGSGGGGGTGGAAGSAGSSGGGGGGGGGSSAVTSAAGGAGSANVSVWDATHGPGGAPGGAASTDAGSSTSGIAGAQGANSYGAAGGGTDGAVGTAVQMGAAGAGLAVLTYTPPSSGVRVWLLTH